MVTRDDDSIMEFIPSKEGLYHYHFNLTIKRKMEAQKEKVLVVNVIVGRPSQKLEKNYQ
jgi:hypothetical protein